MAATAVLVNMVLNDDKEGKVNGHDNQRDDDGYSSKEGRKEGAAYS